ncbi:MAG: bifunctional diguanylate cyclase/phosphodiesterase, partial [Caulobacteraceae bacterium]|nr:bifunctional diguanylate cyclase/phosphodiesterase [Caulobacteraceae bacterium]
MSLGAHGRFMWDATATLEALGAAEAALWFWDPNQDRLSFTGAVRALALSPLAPECSAAAIQALTLPQDRKVVEGFLKVRPPGEEVVARFRMRGG